MTLYCVFLYINYECDMLCAIFDSKEKAIKYISKKDSRDKFYIDTWELNKEYD